MNIYDHDVYIGVHARIENEMLAARRGRVYKHTSVLNGARARGMEREQPCIFDEM